MKHHTKGQKKRMKEIQCNTIKCLLLHNVPGMQQAQIHRDQEDEEKPNGQKKGPEEKWDMEAPRENFTKWRLGQSIQ